jgi:hypothetical protein
VILEGLYRDAGALADFEEWKTENKLANILDCLIFFASLGCLLDIVNMSDGIDLDALDFPAATLNDQELSEITPASVYRAESMKYVYAFFFF